MSVHFYFISLFPQESSFFLRKGILKKAEEKRLVSYQWVNLREFASPPHYKVDGPPYSGGPGMVLRPDVLYRAWSSITDSLIEWKTILLSPQGKVFHQEKAKELVLCPVIIFICGHYEGIDQRFIDLYVHEEISIGEYVVTSGEMPALMIADAVTRLIPGVLGNSQSYEQDSLYSGNLKHPQYTQPFEFQDQKVPDILVSGNHEKIRQWKKEQSEKRTNTRLFDGMTKK